MENNIDDVRAKYKLGSFQHKAINALAKRDLTTYDLKALTKSALGVPEMRRELNTMVREKLLLSVGGDTFSITTAGLNISVLLGPVPDTSKRRRTSADRICNGNATGTYDGAELGHTCLRQGAYDAYLLPSRMGDQMHYPNGRVEASA